MDRPGPRSSKDAPARRASSPRARRVFRLLVVGYAVATMVVMLLPPGTAPQPGGGDKLHHLLVFAVLAALATPAFPGRAGVVVVCVAAYGGALELVQPLMGRHGELGDAIADATGAVLGAGVALLLMHVVATAATRRYRRAASRHRPRH